TEIICPSLAVAVFVLSVVRTLFFCTDAAPPEISTLSLHDALPISGQRHPAPHPAQVRPVGLGPHALRADRPRPVDRRPGQHRRRSEEHTSELQSRENLVCRLLLEKKKTINTSATVI